MRLFNQKGAMFGLDARIALAIFGGLSIVTGAALYGAIGQTNAVRLLVDMQNFNKAFTQYQLDTGTTPSLVSVVPLKDPGTIPPGWNGPYFQGETSGTVGILASNLRIRPQFFVEDDWSTTLTTSATTCASFTAQNCYMWAYVNGTSSLLSLANLEKIDELVDNSDGFATGNFRIRQIAGPTYLAYLKGPKTF